MILHPTVEFVRLQPWRNKGRSRPAAAWSRVHARRVPRPRPLGLSWREIKRSLLATSHLGQMCAWEPSLALLLFLYHLPQQPKESKQTLFVWSC